MCEGGQDRAGIARMMISRPYNFFRGKIEFNRQGSAASLRTYVLKYLSEFSSQWAGKKCLTHSLRRLAETSVSKWKPVYLRSHIFAARHPYLPAYLFCATLSILWTGGIFVPITLVGRAWHVDFHAQPHRCAHVAVPIYSMNFYFYSLMNA